MKLRHYLVTLLTVCVVASLEGGYKTASPLEMRSITLTDRNGLSETIAAKERLKAFSQINFLNPQPYQKVLRLYGQGKGGTLQGFLTSYHPNGELKQYLELVNNRALGLYQEWHPNGTLKIDATIIGGIADIHEGAEKSWLFEGWNRAWNEEGVLIAAIPYVKGQLEGEAVYYHENGAIWKQIPYHKGVLQGTMTIYTDEGALFQTHDFSDNQREGYAYRYWPDGSLAYRELYHRDLLQEATYFDREGVEVATIQGGKGTRALFGKERVIELQEWRNGRAEGRVQLLDEAGALARVYSLKNGMKEGEEIEYFSGTRQPKLLLTWYAHVLQGPVKTWYPEGALESQREMSGNKKNGLLTAWYPNGNLMLVESYDNDRLVKGEYYRIGEKVAVSRVEKGKGLATLFTPEGSYSHKIPYQDGFPTTDS